MNDLVTAAFVRQQSLRWWVAGRVAAGDRGEGVISLAIGVLIMALLGAALWVAFKAMLGHATQNIDRQVSQIGG